MIVISVGVLAFGGAVVNAIANAIANASATVIGPVGFYKKKKTILKISFLKRTLCGNQLQASCVCCMSRVRDRDNVIIYTCNVIYTCKVT